MRGRLTIKETFIRHQVLLDDTEDADILRHLLPSIHFIQAELDKGRGVLVHCHAGISRSATVVAAYLMYSQKLDTAAALEMIRNVRPNIEPNQGFLRQLEIFHQAHYKISQRDKTTRMFYMERALDEVMNGDGSPPKTDMFAKYPHTPTDSTPNTPGHPRRRIRCKMCRHELATREHMLDHGQLGPATPIVRTPAESRRTSASARSSHPSTNQSRPADSGTITETTDARPRRPSLLGFGDLTMSTLGPGSNVSANEAGPLSPVRRQSSGEKSALRRLPGFPREAHTSHSTSALESDDEESLEPGLVESPLGMSHETARVIGRRLSDAVFTPVTEVKESPIDSNVRQSDNSQSSTYTTEKALPTTFISPTDLAAELYSNPKLAALRTPLATPHGTGTGNVSSYIAPAPSAPILANPKCSGYFVEPMKWMDPFLNSGQMAGKIVCPNTKCNAKLGSYDWAGVCCGCKEWVTPGFCINRSKVDEIVK
ncbi:hypothetical protein DXG03_003672 [Asterophora parasitica]|uniref:protein-tyrosine-phosphatase n=1 Tax=Asterophora parasitica TaxID=117018 RepID=A0A9P7KEG6_9AGAR|nr:hypothetical protein DXG03_003672 [Asterophora parasitica]